MGDSGKGKSPHADLGPATTQVTWKVPLREELPERLADREQIRKLENTKKMKTSPDTADYGQKPTGQAAWADTARPPGDVDQNPGRLLKNPTGLPKPRDLVTGYVGTPPEPRPTADEPHLVFMKCKQLPSSCFHCSGSVTPCDKARAFAIPNLYD